ASGARSCRRPWWSRYRVPRRYGCASRTTASGAAENGRNRTDPSLCPRFHDGLESLGAGADSFLTALERTLRQPDRRPVGEPQIDGRDIALQNALLRLEPRKNGQGIVDIVLGQFQNDAIAEMQVPAASGDADIGTYPVLQLGPAGKLVFERGSNGF